MSIILQIWNNFYVISSQVLTKKKGCIKIHGPQPPKTRQMFRIKGYSELWDIQNRMHTQKLVKYL